MFTRRGLHNYKKGGLFKPLKSSCRSKLTFGLQQEEAFRKRLEEDDRLRVHYCRNLDHVYKIDALVSLRLEKHLPPVGVQFTLNSDEEKARTAIESIRRSGIVSRFLYMLVEERLGTLPHGLLYDLILRTARQRNGSGAVYAVLARDEHGEHFVRRLQRFSLLQMSKLSLDKGGY